FDISLRDGVLIGAAIIVAYTFLGGFLAVAIIDTLQGLLMAIVAIVLPVAAFLSIGGRSGLEAVLADLPDVYADPFGGRPGMIAAGFVVGLFATGFGALGQPHLAAWIMASRDAQARVKGAAIAIGWGTIVYAGMAVLGLSAHALFGAEAVAEGIFFAAAQELLPPVFAGIIVAATLSAIMSTVDSQLLVAGSAVSHDLGAARLAGGRTVLVSRIAILLLCLVAVMLTLGLPSTIFDRTLFAWTALGASFGPTVVFRALGWRPTGWGVALSIASGFGASLAYEFWLSVGPGAVWARTVPWGLAFLALMLGGRRYEHA
ncbi:MAG: sodium/proline symporter, partial [Pseudomonadota bacterium]